MSEMAYVVIGWLLVGLAFVLVGIGIFKALID